MIAGIILAAGRSVRMGRPKLLMNLQGKSLIRHVVENALNSELDEVVVVVGDKYEDVVAELRGYPIRIAKNPLFAEGQSTSVIAGMREINRDANAVMVLMGDQPFVTSQIIDAIIACYRERQCLIAAPRYGGEIGSPVLFDRALFAELCTVTGDKGGRDILRSHRDQVCAVPIDSSLAGKDIDTWEEYLEALGAIEARQ